MVLPVPLSPENTRDAAGVEALAEPPFVEHFVTEVHMVDDGPELRHLRGGKHDEVKRVGLRLRLDTAGERGKMRARGAAEAGAPVIDVWRRAPCRVGGGLRQGHGIGEVIKLEAELTGEIGDSAPRDVSGDKDGDRIDAVMVSDFGQVDDRELGERGSGE